jgi:iron-sulfur cluster repair protein YtfE (RIC family)
MEHSGANRDGVNDGDQPGLRMRLAHEARRIASQHAYLDALEATTLRALERGDPLEMRQALDGFHGSLDSHFALEEQVHFPALHGLRAEFEVELLALVREHQRFRSVLVGLGAQARRSPPDPAELAAAFRELAAELGRHEQREERLLAQAPARS